MSSCLPRRASRKLGAALTSSGCGPIGLITGAVAHAYSARKIIGIDNNPKRVEFAKKYLSPITGKPIFDHVFLSTDLPTSAPANGHAQANGHSGLAEKIGEQGSGAGIADGQIGVEEDEDHTTVGDVKWEAAKEVAAKWIEEAGLTAEEGVDRVVEATGAEDCMLLGCAIAKQGGICELGREPHPEWS